MSLSSWRQLHGHKLLKTQDSGTKDCGSYCDRCCSCITIIGGVKYILYIYFVPRFHIAGVHIQKTFLELSKSVLGPENLILISYFVTLIFTLVSSVKCIMLWQFMKPLDCNIRMKCCDKVVHQTSQFKRKTKQKLS